jgi:predicted nucleic acid-binding protein
MADYFLDTSALVKRHVNEPGSRWIRSLLSPKADHTLYIARITTVELYSAITRRQRGGHLSSTQAGVILGHFRRHLANRYNVLELTPGLLNEAMLLARRQGLRAYDAVQLAVAIEVDRLNRQAGFGLMTFISADRELNAAALAEGLAVDDRTNHP